MKIEQRLAELGYELPVPPMPKGAYLPAVCAGGLVFSSGTGSNVNDQRLYTGKVGIEINMEDAQESARLALLVNLANVKSVVGSLDNLRIVKLTGFVNSGAAFHQQAAVIDGASLLLEKLYGERGRHARSAIGVAELPFNLSVEVELVAEILK